MQHSHTHRELIKGKTIHVYINGDIFFEAKAVVVHPKSTRNLDALLNRLTEILNPRFGAVLHLKTPDGLLEIKSLDELQNGASYVAYGKKFQLLDYSDISARRQAIAQGVHALASPREFKRLIVSGRARKIVRQPLLINVFVNGDAMTPAKRVLLQPWVHKTWDSVLEQIASKVKLRTAIRKIIDLSTKSTVSFGTDLEDQQYYVACGSEKFKDFEYGLSATLFTPKQQMAKRYPTLPPIEPKDKHEAPPKPTLSAPPEKSKEEFSPQPPPGKKPDNNTRERANRMPMKLRTPTPEEKEQEETSPSPQHDLHLGHSATNRRVSPIMEQKTPSTAEHGEDASEQAGTGSRNASPIMPLPMDTPSPGSSNKDLSSPRLPVYSRLSQPSPQLHQDEELKNSLDQEKSREIAEETAKEADEVAADNTLNGDASEDKTAADNTLDGDVSEDKTAADSIEQENSEHDNLLIEDKNTTENVTPVEKAGDGNIVIEDRTMADSLAANENTDTTDKSTVDNPGTAEEHSADHAAGEEDNMAGDSKGKEEDAVETTHTPDVKGVDSSNTTDDGGKAGSDAADNIHVDGGAAGDHTNLSHDESKEDEAIIEPDVEGGNVDPEKHEGGEEKGSPTPEETNASLAEQEGEEEKGSTNPEGENAGPEKPEGDDAEKELSDGEKAPEGGEDDSKADKEPLPAETPDKVDDNNNDGDAAPQADPVEALVG